MGRSRGGLTSKIHVVVDGNGLPVQLGLTGGQAHDNRLCSVLLRQLPRRARLLADRGYDAGWIRAFVAERGAWANIPPKCNRKDPICFSPYLYRDRNLVERFFNKIKHCRRVATRYDKLAANYSRSSNSRQSGCGCALMSPRPSVRSLRGKEDRNASPELRTEAALPNKGEPFALKQWARVVRHHNISHHKGCSADHAVSCAWQVQGARWPHRTGRRCQRIAPISVRSSEIWIQFDGAAVLCSLRRFAAAGA